MNTDFEHGQVLFKGTMRVSIPHVRVSRWKAARELIVALLHRRWRTARYRLRVIRTGMDIPTRGIIYNRGA